MYAEPDGLYVAHIDAAKSVTWVEKYDASGLVWVRRVADCVDTHSLTRAGDQFALCSTGTNEVIFLDAHGEEVRRWAPDAAAEGDSWHLNNLVFHQGRLWLTCFGRFERFRGWAGKTAGSGLLLDVESGRAVVEGLSAPHDPCPVEGGWVINDSARKRTAFYPDGGGPPQVLAQLDDFTRGLVLLPDVCVVGISINRYSKSATPNAGVVVVERPSGKVLKTVLIPYREVGHIVPAPAEDVLGAVALAAAAGHGPLPPRGELIAEAERAGAVEALTPLQPSAVHPDIYELRLRVVNNGRAALSSHTRLPLAVSFQILDAVGRVLNYGSARHPLPIPVLPGKSLSFALGLDLTGHRWHPTASALKLTLVQDQVGWWEATGRWTPMIAPLPRSEDEGKRDEAVEVIKADLAQALQAKADLAQALQAADPGRHELEEVRRQLAASRQELGEVKAELESTRARLVSYEDLGPFAFGVARRLRRVTRLLGGGRQAPPAA
jgi:hypothetical protein